MSNRASINNLLAGAFILISLIAGVVTTLVLAGYREGIAQRTSYVVRFNLSDGAEGLDVGSLVKVGGRKAGKVLGLQYFRENGSDVIRAVDVTIGIEKDVRLYRNARVYLQLPLLGSQSQINIPSTGDPGLMALKPGESGIVSPGELIDGRLAPPAFLSQAGYGEEQSDQLRLIIRKGAEISERFARIAQNAEAQLDVSMPALSQAMTDVRAITSEFRQGVGKWMPVVDKALGNVSDATASASLGIQDIRDMILKFNESARAALPRVESILKSLDELAGKANTQLYDQIASAMTSGNKALDEFARISVKAGSLFDELTPEVRLSMANARLASDQLKLALLEIRRNPWRLLYQPGKKELEQELLFDSARAYAASVSNLRAASASLEQTINSAKVPGTAVDTAALKAIQERIDSAFKEYRTAEKKFLDNLINETSK